jgi:hypothetical protein
MTDFESKCYGMSEQEIRDQYLNSITASRCGTEMVVMSILSDCQELLAMKNHDYPQDGTNRYDEMVRKQMNVAKFILSEMMDAREAV